MPVTSEAEDPQLREKRLRRSWPAALVLLFSFLLAAALALFYIAATNTVVTLGPFQLSGAVGSAFWEHGVQRVEYSVGTAWSLRLGDWVWIVFYEH